MVSVDSKIAPIKNLEWNGESLISKVELREQGKGHMVAYVHAADHGKDDYPKLFALREEFKRKGWATSSDNHRGKAVLRVTGIESEAQLTELLKSAGGVQGSPRISQQEVAGQDSKGVVDFVKSNSLRASGILYLLGDILFIITGAKRTLAKGGVDWGGVGMGASFAVGDVALLGFGGRDDKRQFKSLLTKLKTHLDKEGVEIPQGTALTAETISKPGGILEKTYDYIHEHVNTIKLLAEIAGGISIFKSGIDNKDNHFKASGIVIVAGWLAALLIHEKKPDKEKLKDAGPIDKALAYIQEKPLRIAAASGLVHNAIYFHGAFSNRREKEMAENAVKVATGRKDERTYNYRWDLSALSTMLVANSLYSICNKSTGGNIKADALVNDVYGIAAQIVNRQPEAVKEAAINSTVEFLGARPEIKDTKQEIAKRLREEIETQSQNPWFRALRAPEGKPASEGDAKWADAKVKKTLADASHTAAVDQSRSETANQPTR